MLPEGWARAKELLQGWQCAKLLVLWTEMFDTSVLRKFLADVSNQDRFFLK